MKVSEDILKLKKEKQNKTKKKTKKASYQQTFSERIAKGSCYNRKEMIPDRNLEYEI